MKRRMERLAARLRLSLVRMLIIIGIFLFSIVFFTVEALVSKNWAAISAANAIQYFFGAPGWLAVAVVIGLPAFLFTALITIGLFMGDRKQSGRNRQR